MNKEYIYLDGKCIVEDEKGNQRVEKYTDKFDEILLTENRIEILENEYKQTNEDIKRREKQNKPNKLGIYFSPLLALTIPVFTQLLVICLVGPNATEIIAQVNETTPLFIKVLTLSTTALFGLSTTYGSYRTYKNNKKAIEGQKSKKKEIEKSLIEEKQDLERLNKEKQEKQPERYFYKKEICNLEQLRQIRNYLNLYYDCGYNFEKYRKYYQEGKLEQKLRKYYSEYGLGLVENYLEENEQEIQRTLSK